MAIAVVATIAVMSLAAGVLSSGAVSQAFGRHGTAAGPWLRPLTLTSASQPVTPAIDVSVASVSRPPQRATVTAPTITAPPAPPSGSAGASSSLPLAPQPSVICATPVRGVDAGALLAALPPSAPAAAPLPSTCPEPAA